MSHERTEHPALSRAINALGAMPAESQAAHRIVEALAELPGEEERLTALALGLCHMARRLIAEEPDPARRADGWEVKYALQAERFFIPVLVSAQADTAIWAAAALCLSRLAVLERSSRELEGLSNDADAAAKTDPAWQAARRAGDHLEAARIFGERLGELMERRDPTGGRNAAAEFVKMLPNELLAPPEGEP